MRIRLCFSSYYSQICQQSYLFIPQNLSYIVDLMFYIQKKFSLPNCILKIDGFFLLPSDSIKIIKDEDIINVFPSSLRNNISSSNSSSIEEKDISTQTFPTTKAIPSISKMKQKKYQNQSTTKKIKIPNISSLESTHQISNDIKNVSSLNSQSQSSYSTPSIFSEKDHYIFDSDDENQENNGINNVNFFDNKTIIQSQKNHSVTNTESNSVGQKSQPELEHGISITEFSQHPLYFAPRNVNKYQKTLEFYQDLTDQRNNLSPKSTLNSNTTIEKNEFPKIEPEVDLKNHKPLLSSTSDSLSLSQLDYSIYPILTQLPKQGDIIAFQTLNLSPQWTPILSNYQEMVITDFNNDGNLLVGIDKTTSQPIQMVYSDCYHLRLIQRST